MSQPKNSRLQFTDAERGDPRLKEHIRRTDKAADKADAAQAKVSKKKKLVKYRQADPATGKSKTHLRFEDVDKPAPASKLSHAVKAAPLTAISAQAHRKIQEAEQDNVGVESAHRLEEVSEGGVQLAAHSRRAQKLRPYREAEKARMKLGQANVAALYMLYDKDTHKQFITVEGRDGHTFYIVIDYDAPVNGKEEQYQTYFLNKVDEADLAALVEQGEPAACSCTEKCHAGAVNTSCPLCAVNMTECVGKEPEPSAPVESQQPDPSPEPEKPSGGSGLLVVVGLALLAGGGAAYFLKFKKKKPDTKGSADLDDYDYGDDNEYSDAGDEPEGGEDE